MINAKDFREYLVEFGAYPTTPLQGQEDENGNALNLVACRNLLEQLTPSDLKAVRNVLTALVESKPDQRIFEYFDFTYAACKDGLASGLPVEKVVANIPNFTVWSVEND